MKKRNLDFTINAHFYLKRNPKTNKEVMLINFAKRCQKALKKEKMQTAYQICEILGYELKPRLEVSQYSYRKGLKCKVNGKSYLLQKRES